MIKEIKRMVIEKVTPQIDDGLYPIKRVPGEKVVVRANVFAEGHDEVVAYLLFRALDEKQWQRIRMKPLGNDRWIASFKIEKEKDYYYCIQGYIDDFATWRKDLEKKIAAGQDVSIDIQIGVKLISCAVSQGKGNVTALQKVLDKIEKTTDISEKTHSILDNELLDVMQAHLDEKKSSVYYKELKVRTERHRAAFSSWYEFFPRSWSTKPGKHGTFKDCERILSQIAAMGFNVVYLPPIHPIGTTNRKGKNNAARCEKGEPGSPWAIGDSSGGHKAIHPELGTLEDFTHFIQKAKEYNLEVALDLAYQCSPDHPYVKAHPQWFKWRPDGTVQFAENPPKKYEDVLPINFDTEDWQNLWKELKSIVEYWVKQGVKIFRVDNPHTKPFGFWDWLIEEIKKDYPGTLFLAEAFTRPNVMYRLAKGGFTQSYTYFTWRNTKKEFIEYMTELTTTEAAEYFRPNFWPNTPDILPEHLQYGSRPAFMIRAVLAATLSSNFGIYGPAFELCEAEALPGKEEYLYSEKYEIKQWDWEKGGNLKEFLRRLNKVRQQHPCLQLTRNIRFCDINNENLIAYYKATGDFSDIILVVVNLDPHHTQIGWLNIPIDEIGLESNRTYLAHDLLSDDKYIWQGGKSYIELNPNLRPAHIIHLRRHMRRESDFDYFM